VTESPIAWHALSPHQAAARLQSDPESGLSEQQAQERLARLGRNVLPEGKRRTLPAMFADQFKDFLVLILVAAAVISAAIALLAPRHADGLTDAMVIAAILVLNAVLGVVQEHKAGRALEALKKMSIPQCEVIRSARSAQVSSEDLSPGDLVVLREGDFVPADLRLVEARNLRVDEASLTGESAPVEKTAEAVAEESPLPERASMAYAGTHVTYGRGRGLAVATGLEREIGRIAQMLQAAEQVLTPLQRNLAGLGKLLGMLALGVCAVIFAVGIAEGQAPFEMFMTAVSLAVAAVPEGLPAIVTIVLALGVYRMSRHQAIVRKLPAVETLGCATYICTDKTGTLTENRMAVQQALTAGEVLHAGAGEGQEKTDLVCIAALCNDAHVDRHGPWWTWPNARAWTSRTSAAGTGAWPRSPSTRSGR
jgi:Ca2+-transporting ATPase